MSTLFVRIFLSFWLAMTLIGVAFGAMYVFADRGTLPARIRAFTRAALLEHGRELRADWQRQGDAAVRERIETFDEEYGLPTGLLRDEEWVGDRLDGVPRDFLQRAIRTTEPLFESDDHLALYAVPLDPGRPRTGTADPDAPPAAHWVVVARVERRSRLERYVGPDTLGLRLAVVFLISGLVCYGLARYLTRPIRRVREVARELARGNLAARVAAAGATASDGHGSRDELVALTADIDRMAERISVLLESERRLLADISHELRSPLARLNVAVEIARGRAGSADADIDTAAALERIQGESDRLARLVDEVLTLSRLDAEVQMPETAPLDLGELVAQVVSDADYEASARDRHVEFERPGAATLPAEPVRVTGNEELLRRAIDNVVRNAVHFTAPDTTVHVTLTRDPAADAVRLTVRDRGPGVPEAELADIFRPFHRVERARERAAGGTGLGLAITARAIRLHGGTVTARNETDPPGLTIEMLVPLHLH